jgi:simple sugar transport system ATP-binding protein
MPPLVRAAGIARRFGALQAVAGVDFEARPGEIHALLGENGAGKSTLLKLLAGRLRSDAGRIFTAAAAPRAWGPAAARAAGIGLLPQHLSVIANLTVRENLWLALPPGTPRAGADRAARRFLPGLDPERRAGDLSLGERQAIDLARLLARECRVLLLDEPTAVLAPAEIDALAATLRALRDEGRAVVLVTHKFADVARLADRVTVMRAGRVAARFTPPFDEAAVVHAAVGAAAPPPPRPAVAPGARLVTWRGVLAPGAAESALELHGGEIVALVGVDGNGQRELTAALLGHAGGHTRERTVAAPWALIPEDRQTEGLVLGWSAAENLVPRHERAFGAGSWLSPARVAARAQALLARFDVRPAGPGTPAGALSGGNQQKLILARELGLGAPRWVLAFNPTRGLDFRASAALYQALAEARAAGLGVLLITLDLDEALLLGDRFGVFYRGVLTPVAAGRASRDALGRLMLGLAA